MAIRRFPLNRAYETIAACRDLADSIDSLIGKMDESFPPGWKLSKTADALGKARSSLNTAVGFMESALGEMYMDAVGDSRPADAAEYEIQE